MASDPPVYDPKATSIPVLRYLVAVATHLHFARAASACRVSQPTLSALIATWEKRVRVRVFERNQHGVRVTPAGERIIAAARAALIALEAVENAAGEAKPPFYGPVRLGLIPTVAPYALPFIIPAIERAHPELELPLREDTTAELLKAIDAGRIDVAILALVPGLGQRHAIDALYREPFLIALPRGHRLGAQASITGDQLGQERLLLLAEGHCLRDQALALCNRLADAGHGADYRATSLETLRQMVIAGLGITLLPELAVDAPFGSQRGLTVRQFAKPAPSRTVGAVWRKSSTRTAAIRELCRVVQTTLAGKS